MHSPNDVYSKPEQQCRSKKRTCSDQHLTEFEGSLICRGCQRDLGISLVVNSVLAGCSVETIFTKIMERLAEAKL